MKKLILDLDTGVDDALAISYALGSPEVELIGITGTYGNVLMEQGVRNALAITELLGHPEVPVYKGLPHASTKDSFEVLPISAFIHGENGIGDAVIPDPKRDAETEPAVDFIIDAVKTYGDDLVYVPTGPQTNIAAAFRKAPEIAEQLGKIVLMGGALTVPGNVNRLDRSEYLAGPRCGGLCVPSYEGCDDDRFGCDAADAAHLQGDATLA